MDSSLIYASIITIGDELLIGQVVDTNSSWMATELNKAGVWMKRRVAVGDNKSDIVEALNQESSKAQIVLITGGLGPTADDITKPVLCEYFGGKLVTDPGALQNVQDIFARLQRPMLAVNLKQAEVPDTCTVIQNKRGTAPGMWFEKEGKIFVSMPGVPHEMKGMMTDYVIPALQQHFRMPAIVSHTLLTAGIGESFLSELIKDFEQSLPPEVKLAYLPNYGMVRLRLTGISYDVQALQATAQARFEELKEQVKEYLVTDRDEPLSHVVARLLQDAGKTLSTAESCTGGYIAHLITQQSGASRHFKGSVVSYDNQVKGEVLHVQQTTLQTVGAVSEETVREMVQGALAVLKSDYALAVSGIMGPDGGTPEKPVGTVWVAAGNSQQTITQKFQFRFDRQRNIELTANNALNLLRKLIVSEKA
ncbi:MAG: competence/damage-inducible protein A [Williamsia sp.]|nr:competence/damage-inducible protein A [Williamsia sp.]